MARMNAYERELAWQLRELVAACRAEKVDADAAMWGYTLGAYAAMRVAATLLAKPNRMRAMQNCGRLLSKLHDELEWQHANPPK